MTTQTKRFLIPTAVGFILAIVYWVLLLTSGFDTIQRASPMLGDAIEISLYPSQGLLALIHALGLPPHGDAGFIWFAILPGLQWIIIGLVGGMVWVMCKKLQE